MSKWSAATLARWCSTQGDALRTPHFSVTTLLAGVDGAALLAMSDYALDELGVPARMRVYLRAKQPPLAELVAVEAQVEAAERHSREFVKSISNRDASERRGSAPGGHSTSAPASREVTTKVKSVRLYFSQEPSPQLRGRLQQHLAKMSPSNDVTDANAGSAPNAASAVRRRVASLHGCSTAQKEDRDARGTARSQGPARRACLLDQKCCAFDNTSCVSYAAQCGAAAMASSVRSDAQARTAGSRHLAKAL